MKRFLHIIVPVRIEIDKLGLLMAPRTIKEEMRQEMGYLDFFEDPKHNKLPSKKILCAKYLNLQVDGVIGRPHTLDYFQDPIPTSIIQFATLEAYHYRLLCETMVHMIENDITMPQPSTQFQVGTKVKIYIGSKVNHVAEGIIEYLGGINCESIAFGEKIVNKALALVRIVEVLKWDARPKYLKETHMLYGSQWERDINMGTIYTSPLPIVVVDTKRLVRMDEVDKNLWVEKPKIKKKLSKARIKKIKKRKNHNKERKLDMADAEAQSSNFWQF
jgi:hypothetical protein